VVASQTRARFDSIAVRSPAAQRAADRTAAIEAGGSPWFQLAGLSATVGCLAAGIAGVAGHPHWQVPALGVGAGFAMIALGAAFRSRGRRRRAARTADRLAPMLGLAEATPYQRSRLVRVRWPLGARRTDPPSRVTICPPASYPLTDAVRLERIADVTGRTLRTQLRVAAVRRRRHEVVLVPARLTDAAAAEPASRELRCAEVVVEQRLGIEAAVVATSYATDDVGEQQLDTFEVRFVTDEHNTDPDFWVEFEAAFNRQVPGRWQALPDLVADPVTRQARCRIRQKPTLSTRIPYDLGLLDQCGEYEIPYAVDEYGQLVTWSLDVSPHMLVSGATRSGKSSTLRNVVRGFVARGWAALVCDPRRTGLLGMRGWPGVQALATPTDPRQLIAIVDHVHAEMDRRHAAVEAGVARKSDLEPMLLVLDEYRELLEEIMQWWTRERADEGQHRTPWPPVLDRIDAIARHGGEAGVHLVMGIKRPDLDAEILPVALGSNCRCRCSHGALTKDEALLMWGNDASGRSVPPMIQGRSTALRTDGTPGEVQSLWFPDPLELHGDDVDLYRRLQPTESPHPWLVPGIDSLVPTATAPDTPWSATPVRTPDDPTPAGSRHDAAGQEWDLRYGEADSVPAGTVREADLIEVELGLGVWIVVDDVAADPDEPDLLYIDGRTVDSGQPKTVVADEDALVRRRTQI
jgi:DNA translocase FtsK/SpoIIIE-like protein